MEGKNSKFIVKPRVHQKLVHHDMRRASQEIGLGYDYMSRSLVPEADIQVGVQRIDHVPPDFQPFIEPHKHEVSQFYGIVGDLSLEVILEDEKYVVDGPTSIFIPAGMMHSFRPLRGNGYVLVVLRRGEYV